MRSIYDQARAMSRAQLRAEVEDRVSGMVPTDGRGGPDLSALRKADSLVDEIMALVDAYHPAGR
jgi:hypothetical protein